MRTDKYLLSAAFLQSVYHLLKLQGCDLHFLVQLIHKRVVLRVQVVVWLLRIQTESCIRDTDVVLFEKVLTADSSTSQLAELCVRPFNSDCLLKTSLLQLFRNSSKFSLSGRQRE